MPESTDDTAHPQKPSRDDSSPTKRAGTRLLLVTTSLTALVLAIAAGVVMYKIRAARQKLDDQYSRLTAGLAQETDLRISSYETLASVVGNAVYDNYAQITEASAKAADTARATRGEVQRSLQDATRAATEAKRLGLRSKGTVDRAQKTFQDAVNEWFKANHALEETGRIVSGAAAVLSGAKLATGQVSTVAAPFGARTAAEGHPDADQNSSPRVVDTTGFGTPNAAADAPAKPTDLEATLESAQLGDEQALLALSAAETKERITRQAASAALVALQEATSSASQVGRRQVAIQDHANDLQLRLESVLERIAKTLHEGHSRAKSARLTFVPEVVRNLRLSSGEGQRRIAEAVATTLVGDVPAQDRPEIVPCPGSAADQASAQLLIRGRKALFPIRARSPPRATRDDETPRTEVEHESSQVPPKAASSNLCLQIPIESVVAFGPTQSERVGYPRISTERQPFDELLLSERESCRVLQWSDTEPLARLTTLPGCNTPENASKSSASSIGVAPKVESVTLQSSPESVSIGSTSYRAFRQPIRAAVLYERVDSDSSTRYAAGSLVMVGLVQASVVEGQARSLDPMDFLFVVALAAIAVITWPVAKLWLSGQKTRFTRIDSAFLASSALIAAFIAVMVALAFVANARLTDLLTGRLHAIERSVSAQLDDSLDQASRQLEAFISQTSELRNRHLAGPMPTHALTPPDGFTKSCRSPTARESHFTNWQHAEDDNHRWPICEIVSKDPLLSTGPRTSAAFWVNASGFEQIQAHDAPEGQPPVNVALRHYFQRAKRNCEFDPGDTSRRSDVAEVVRSLTSTKKVLVVARAVPCSEETTAGGVAGFEQELASFQRFSLPPGFEWAVIDSSGMIMLHSSIDEHHGHNLFDDLDAASTSHLRIALQGATSFSGNGEYRGARTRMYARPNAKSGWYVVALGSHRPIESILKGTLTTTAATFGLFVTFIVLFAILVVFLMPGRTRRREPSDASVPKSPSDAPSANAPCNIPVQVAQLVDGVPDSRSLDLLPESRNSDSMLDTFARTPVGHTFSIPPHGAGVRWYAAVARRLGFGSLMLLAIALMLDQLVPTTLLLCSVAALLMVVVPSIPGVLPTSERRGPVRSETMLDPRKWSKRVGPTYTLCCLAFCTAFVIVPTAICFVGSFAASVENAVRIEQLSLVPPPGCESSKDPPMRCPHPVQGMEPRLVEASTELASEWSVSRLTWPIPAVMRLLRADYLAGEDSESFRWKRTTRSLSLGPRSDSSRWELRSELPRLLSNWHDSTVLLVALGSLLIGLASHRVAQASLRRMFFVDTLEERRSARTLMAPPPLSSATLFIFPPPQLLMSFRSTNESIHLTPADLADSPKALACDLAKVKLIVADFDPLRRVTEPFRHEWAKALLRFTVVYGPGMARSLDSSPRFSNHASFLHEWSLCDTDERRVLAQLAVDGHVSPHPKNGPVLRHLAGRGLIDDDTLTLDDVEWSDYIRQTVSTEQIRAWQSGEADVSWHVIRVPLIAAVAAILSVVAISHPELADSGALLLTPVAAGLPAVLRYVAAFARGRRGDSFGV